MVPVGVDSTVAVTGDSKTPCWVGGSSSGMLYKSRSVYISNSSLSTNEISNVRPVAFNDAHRNYYEVYCRSLHLVADRRSEMPLMGNPKDMTSYGLN